MPIHIKPPNIKTPNPDEHLKIGQNYFERQKYQAAIVEFTKAIELRTIPNPWDFHWRGKAYSFSKQYNLAIKDFKRAIRSKEKPEAEYYFALAAAYLERESRFNAIGYNRVAYYLGKAISLDNSDPDYYYHRAKIYSALEKYPQALDDYEQSLALCDKPHSSYVYPPKIHKDRAAIYIDMRDYQTAVKVCQQGIELFPSSFRELDNREESEIYYYLHQYQGLSHYALDNLAEALENYDKIFALCASYFNLGENHWQMRGMIYYELKNYDAAIKDFNEVLKSRPKPCDQHRLGLAYQSLGYAVKATKTFELASQYECVEAEDYFGVAKAHYSLGNHQTALKLINQHFILCTNPSEYFYYWRSKIYFALQDYLSAQQDYECLIKLNPYKREFKEHGRQLEEALAKKQLQQASDAIIVRAQGYFLSQAYDQALAEIGPILQQQPNHAEALWLKGISLMALQEFTTARQALDRLYLYSTNHRLSVLIQRSFSYCAERDTENALIEIESALNLLTQLQHPVPALVWLCRAYCHVSEKAYAAAVADYKRAIAASEQSLSLTELLTLQQEQALAKLPQYLKRAQLRLDQQKQKEAEHYLQEAKEFLVHQNFKQALALSKRALQSVPNYAEAHFISGKIYQRLGNWQQAVTSYQHAYDNNIKHSSIKLKLSNAEVQLEKQRFAIWKIQKLATLVTEKTCQGLLKGIDAIADFDHLTTCAGHNQAESLDPTLVDNLARIIDMELHLHPIKNKLTKQTQANILAHRLVDKLYHHVGIQQPVSFSSSQQSHPRSKVLTIAKGKTLVDIAKAVQNGFTSAENILDTLASRANLAANIRPEQSARLQYQAIPPKKEQTSAICEESHSTAEPNQKLSEHLTMPRSLFQQLLVANQKAVVAMVRIKAKKDPVQCEHTCLICIRVDDKGAITLNRYDLVQDHAASDKGLVRRPPPQIIILSNHDTEKTIEQKQLVAFNQLLPFAPSQPSTPHPGFPDCCYLAWSLTYDQALRLDREVYAMTNKRDIAYDRAGYYSKARQRFFTLQPAHNCLTWAQVLLTEITKDSETKITFERHWLDNFAAISSIHLKEAEQNTRQVINRVTCQALKLSCKPTLVKFSESTSATTITQRL